jgi:hypothetical protein
VTISTVVPNTVRNSERKANVFHITTFIDKIQCRSEDSLESVALQHLSFGTRVKRIMSEKEREINESMARVARELESPYATYPLKRTHWLDANAPASTTEDGNDAPKAFISHRKDKNFPTPTPKPDYVWGAGRRGFGYYHLLTIDSYQILNKRVRDKGPPLNCCCVGSSNAEFSRKDYDVVAEILHNRSLSPVPDDMVAAKNAIDIARGVAQAEYSMSQNVQLVVMAAF